MTPFEIEISPAEMILGTINLLIYLVCPAGFIWAVNTLFLVGIPFSIKTWAAGFLLVVLARFIIRGSVWTLPQPREMLYDDMDDDLYEEDDFYGDADSDFPNGRSSTKKGKLILHPACQDDGFRPTDNR